MPERISEDDDSPGLQRQISVNTEIVRNVPPIDNIVKADVGMSWGYLFSFRMIIGYFGEKNERERERERDHIRKYEDFSCLTIFTYPIFFSI